MKITHILLFLLLSGCATSQGIDEHVDFNPTGHSAVYRDQYVRKSPLEVYVEPMSKATYIPKVLYLPFRVTQEISNPTIIGYSTARSIWQTWSAMRVFPTMEFSGDDTPFRRDRAVILAKQRGAELVIGGFVTYLYAGGTAGDTSIAVQLEAIDVASGQTVWSMAQSALLPAAKKRDYFLFAVKERMPSDPLMACIRAIAIDMGKKMQDWQSSSSTEKPERGIDQRIHDSLYSNPYEIPKAEPSADSDTSASGL